MERIRAIVHNIYYRMLELEEAGELPQGRAYEVARSHAEQAAWQHGLEDWKQLMPEEVAHDRD